MVMVPAAELPNLSMMYVSADGDSVCCWEGSLECIPNSNSFGSFSLLFFSVFFFFSFAKSKGNDYIEILALVFNRQDKNLFVNAKYRHRGPRMYPWLKKPLLELSLENNGIVPGKTPRFTSNFQLSVNKAR